SIVRVVRLFISGGRPFSNETPDFNIGIDQHPSKLSDNRQETAKSSI
ncbi:unnamed protein product, partial [Rotaria sordida]